jgi:hypothetical protein
MPVPEDTGVFLAKGNTASCSAQGFILHLSISNFMYNVCLMLTFLAIVRYGGKEETIAARYEKLMHIITIGVPLIAGGVALFLQMFNPVAPLGLVRCYIAAYPPDCDITEGVECTRGANARTFQLFFSVAPVCIGLIIIFASIFLVWWTVDQNDRQTRRHGRYNTQNTSRAVAIQSLIYGFFFFNTYVWLMLGFIVVLAFPNSSGTKFGVTVRFLAEVFYWSQGFFNFLIFLRPRYIRIRSTCKHESVWWAFREAIVGVKVEDYSSNEVGRPTSRTPKYSQSSGGDSNFMARSMRYLKDTLRASGNSSELVTTTADISQSYRGATPEGGLATTPDVPIRSSFRVKPDGSAVVAVESSVEAPETNNLAGIDPE